MNALHDQKGDCHCRPRARTWHECSNNLMEDERENEGGGAKDKRNRQLAQSVLSGDPPYMTSTGSGGMVPHKYVGVLISCVNATVARVPSVPTIINLICGYRMSISPFRDVGWHGFDFLACSQVQTTDRG